MPFGKKKSYQLVQKEKESLNQMVLIQKSAQRILVHPQAAHRQIHQKD